MKPVEYERYVADLVAGLDGFKDAKVDVGRKFIGKRYVPGLIGNLCLDRTRSTRL